MMTRVTEVIYSIALAAFLSRTPGISKLVEWFPGLGSVLLIMIAFIFMHAVVNGRLQEIRGVNVAVNSIIGLITGAVIGYGVTYVTGQGAMVPILSGAVFGIYKAFLTWLANRKNKPKMELDTSGAALGKLADEINWTIRVFPLRGSDVSEMEKIKTAYKQLCADYEAGYSNVGIRADEIGSRLNALRRSVSARAMRGKEERGYGYFRGCKDKEDIKRRYKELVKKYHPDAVGGNEKMFMEITKQYKEMLSRA